MTCDSPLETVVVRVVEQKVVLTQNNLTNMGSSDLVVMEKRLLQLADLRLISNEELARSNEYIGTQRMAETLKRMVDGAHYFPSTDVDVQRYLDRGWIVSSEAALFREIILLASQIATTSINIADLRVAEAQIEKSQQRLRTNITTLSADGIVGNPVLTKYINCKHGCI